MRPISVLIIDGERGLSLLVARCLAQIPNLRLHVLSEVSWAALRASRHRASYQTSRVGDDLERLDAIQRAARRTGADVILAVTERAIQFTLRHQQELGRFAALPPLPPPREFTTATDKWLLAGFATQHRLSIPATIRIERGVSVDDLARKIDFPVLIKPMRGEGGKGIRKFDHPSELAWFLRRHPDEDISQRIVQHFIPGRDIDCSILCRDGRLLAYTIQRPIVSPVDDFAPAPGIEFVEDSGVLDLAERWARLSNWSGVAHLDMRYAHDEAQPRLLEVNARYWTSLLGSLQMGVNFPYLSCLAALDVPFPSPGYRYGRYFEVGAALRQRIARLAGTGGVACRLDETALRFGIEDPFAEALHFVRRVGLSRVHSHRQHAFGH